MKHFCAELGLFWVTFGVLLTPFAAHATEHDLVCYKILQPSGEYVLADSTITPTLAIANLVASPEYNFYVHLLTIDTLYGDTVYAESVLVNYIEPFPDSVEVEFPEWTPQGLCKDSFSGVISIQAYGMVGFTRMITDENNSNDTLRDTVTSLWKHDVGVTDIDLSPKPNNGGGYPPGSAITFTATVENFGFNQESDLFIKMEIVDHTANPDTLIWQNIQFVSSLGWRGDSLGNPFITDVSFPIFTVPSDNWMIVSCKTGLEGDLCPFDDISPVINIRIGVEEKPDEVKTSLEFVSPRFIMFTLLSPSWVRLEVFDASGRFIRNLYNDPCSAGSHSLTWDGKDLRGRKVPSGAYFVKMQAGAFAASSKLIVIK